MGSGGTGIARPSLFAVPCQSHMLYYLLCAVQILFPTLRFTVRNTREIKAVKQTLPESAMAASMNECPPERANRRPDHLE